LPEPAHFFHLPAVVGAQVAIDVFPRAHRSLKRRALDARDGPPPPQRARGGAEHGSEGGDWPGQRAVHYGETWRPRDGNTAYAGRSDSFDRAAPPPPAREASVNPNPPPRAASVDGSAGAPAPMDQDEIRRVLQLLAGKLDGGTAQAAVPASAGGSQGAQPAAGAGGPSRGPAVTAQFAQVADPRR
jgi:hypothetical protein